jgi:hypothetical protein
MRIQVNQLLSERMFPDQFTLRFNQIMLNPDGYYDDLLASKVEFNRDLADNYLLQIINSMTDKQTQHYRKELRDWRELAQNIRS